MNPPDSKPSISPGQTLPYTVERLELAKRLFLNKPSKDIQETDKADKIRKYSLRKRRQNLLLSTWIDTDETDDYDPKLDYNFSRRRAPRRQATSSSSRIVTMSLQSEAGKRFLSSLSMFQDDEDDPVILPDEYTENSTQHMPDASSNNQNTLNIAKTKTITTSFAHPIDFTYDPPVDGSKPCHWCDNVAYGILGLGRREVEVVDIGQWRYSEIRGGHVAEGRERSRMCIGCALSRVHITDCPGHRIVPIRGCNPATFDYAGAYNSLTGTGGQSATGSRTQYHWCALCPQPAFFACSTIQTVDVYQQPVDPLSVEALGCGLLLCERCRILMQHFGGEIALVVERNEREDGEDGSRADAVYLVPGNELYQTYVALKDL